MESRKEHWENVYATRQPHGVSWTQELPKTSLDFVHSFRYMPKTFFFASLIASSLSLMLGGSDNLKLIARNEHL
jgi:hypothetical protein